MSCHFQYACLLPPWLKLFLAILFFLMQLFDIDIELPFDSASQFLGIDLKKYTHEHTHTHTHTHKNTDLKRYMHTYVHYSSIYDSQDMKTIQVFINR